MALTLYRHQVAINMDSALPEDDIMNTFHFKGEAGPSTATDTAAIATAVGAFYNAIDGSIFPNEVAATADFKTYDLSNAVPRVPVFEGTHSLTPSGTTGIPTEAAICLSFEGSPVSGVNQARRRGRLFLGPLSTECVQIVGGKTVVEADRRGTIATAASALRAAAIAADLEWGVYSPSEAAFDGDISAFTAVASGWVDNAFDTIRKRGTAPTVRTTWS